MIELWVIVAVAALLGLCLLDRILAAEATSVRPEAEEADDTREVPGLRP